MNLQAGNGIHDSFNLSREAVNYGEVTDCTLPLNYDEAAFLPNEFNFKAANQ